MNHGLQQIHQIFNPTAMLGVQLCLQFQELSCNHNIAILFCCQNHVQGTSEWNEYISRGGQKQIHVKLHVYVRSPFRLNNEYTFCYMMCCMVFFYVLSCRNNVFCYNNFTPSVPSVMLVNHVICLHCLVAIVTNRNYFL